MELGRLGEVLARTVASTAGPDHDVEAVVQGSFERIGRSSTIAVARWIAGESLEVAIEAGRESWEIFGELAVLRDEFFLVYQPTIGLSDMSPSGVEALIRWRHPQRGELQPDTFIPLLEETGLIGEVGKWVLDQACAQGAAWRAAGHPISIAVNVSARRLDTDQITADIEGALGASGLNPEALTIEVTETTLMRNAEETARRLTTIKGLGGANRDRRLRHRLLLARSPAALPG